jgi:hypothetical protein
MATQKVKIIAEFPEGLRKLTKKEASALKLMFRSEFANVLGAEAGKSVASLEFDNITSAPIAGGKKAAKKGAKKSGKKGAKKPNK